MNVHYNFEQKIMDFISDQIQHVAPANIKTIYLIKDRISLYGFPEIIPYNETKNKTPIMIKKTGLYLNTIPFF